jgi:NTE family protein
MDRERMIDLMVGKPMFHGASEKVLGDFVDHGEVIRIKDGEIMIEQGRIGEAVWMLLDGKVSIIVDGTVSHDLDAPGTILGEISAVSHTAATATVMARDGEVAALRISHQQFHKALATSPGLAASVLRSLAKYL